MAARREPRRRRRAARGGGRRGAHDHLRRPEHHDDPRQLAHHLGSDWEGAARFVGSPVFRAALGEWAGQFGDLDLLGAVERLDDGDVPLDHHVIALIGALYDVRLDGHRGVGRSWYRGRVLNVPILHQICERALEDVEGARGRGRRPGGARRPPGAGRGGAPRGA